MVADLGSLKLTNIVSQVHGSGSGSNPGAVLLDTMKLTMQGLNAKVDAEGHKGGNIIREYHEGTQVCPLCNYTKALRYLWSIYHRICRDSSVVQRIVMCFPWGKALTRGQFRAPC
jgi:hypothetical protein